MPGTGDILASTIPTSSTRLKTSRPAWERARPWVLGAALLTVLSVSLYRRLAMLHRLSFDWDEGVYWQSLESIRHGHPLFREVFSSQPPFFLGGLSTVYNLLGGGIVAGRLPVMVGSMASLVGIFFIGRALAGSRTGLMAMAFLAFDPLYLELSDRLQADLPCVAIGVIGVAVAAQAYRHGGSSPWLLAGGLVGLSIMTKFLGVVFILPVAWFVFYSQGSSWRALLAAGSGLLLAVAVVLAPYTRDLAQVYRQAIGLHLGARVSEPQTFREKLDRIAVSYPAVVPALAGLVSCAAGAIGRVRWVAMLGAWLLAALAADLAQGPLFIHHLVLLAPPLALLAGAAPGLLLELVSGGSSTASGQARPGGRAWVIAGLATALAAVLGVVAMTSPLPAADHSTAPTIAAIKAFVPAGVTVVTDEPFAAAYTGHQVPANLVDQSHARITSGELTTARVVADTEAAGARAVIFSTGRLDSLSGFPEWVARHFRLAHDGGGGLQVWVRDHN